MEMVISKSRLVSEYLFKNTQPYLPRPRRYPISHSEPFTGSPGSVQKIDLVPTHSSSDCPFPSAISVPISQSHSGSDFAKALDVNAHQVSAYLDTSTNNTSGGEPDGVWGMFPIERAGRKRQSLFMLLRLAAHCGRYDTPWS